MIRVSLYLEDLCKARSRRHWHFRLRRELSNTRLRRGLVLRMFGNNSRRSPMTSLPHVDAKVTGTIQVIWTYVTCVCTVARRARCTTFRYQPTDGRDRRAFWSNNCCAAPQISFHRSTAQHQPSNDPAAQAVPPTDNLPWWLHTSNVRRFKTDHHQLGRDDELLRAGTNLGRNVRLGVLRLKLGDLLLILKGHDNDCIEVDTLC